MPDKRELARQVEQRSLDSWDEFQEELSKLDKFHTERKELDETSYVSDLLFRGQADSCWNLRTTLERESGEDEFDVLRYDHIIKRHKAEIEAFIGRTWDLPDLKQDNLRRGPLLLNFPIKIYEYMAHLRQHGFPSPLLDWSTSPYVAAYFAFSSRSASNDSVAIFAYLEYAGHSKSGFSAEPHIDALGPSVKAPTRHFLQRSQYTICTRKDGEQRFFVPHDSAFKRDDSDQDLLWKFTIPRSERSTVLRYLDRHNITAFSLFASEDRLMESIAIRAFVLD